MPRFSVGDMVIIGNTRGSNWNDQMDKWLGRTMTIRFVNARGYWMEEDRREHSGFGWFWEEGVIKCLASDTGINEAEPEVDFDDLTKKITLIKLS